MAQGWILLSCKGCTCDHNVVYQTRSTDKFELITAGEKEGVEATLDLGRLSNASLDGPSVTLAYMADNKTHVNCTLDLTFSKLTFLSERTNRGSTPIHINRLHGQRHRRIHLCQNLFPIGIPQTFK